MNALVVILLGLCLFFMGATVILMCLVREYGKMLHDTEPLDPVQFEEDQDG